MPLGPGQAAAALPRADARLRFCEILMTLELCRHPQSENQVNRVEAYVSALGVNEVELQVIRESLEQGADKASKDLERFYGGILPEISEVSLRDNYLRLTEPDHELATRLRALHDLPERTLGNSYVEFYRRNGITLPGDDIHLPAHYVNHESGGLNHGAIRAKVSTLDRQGVPELFGEGLERGSRCSVDLSQLDHLALAELPLEQVPKQFNVVPLAHPMV